MALRSQTFPRTGGQLALQGPKAEEILAKVADPSLIPAGYYTANFDGSIKGIPCVLSRTGYTGEGLDLKYICQLIRLQMYGKS